MHQGNGPGLPNRPIGQKTGNFQKQLSVSEMPAFDWVDIVPTGTEVVFGNLYTGSEQLAIGFPFPYYGATFDQLSVHVKGYMTFGDGEPSQFLGFVK